MKFGVKTAPTVLPVTLTEVKDHLRITHDTQDDLLTIYLKAAIEEVEAHTGLTLAQTTFYGYTESIGEEVEIKKYPLSSVASVKYYDSDGVQQTMNVANYRLDSISIPPKVIIEDVPSVYYRSDAVTIEFTAGYSSIPDGIKAAILLQVGYLYENSGDNPKQLMTASERLLTNYRVFHSDWF